MTNAHAPRRAIEGGDGMLDIQTRWRRRFVALLVVCTLLNVVTSFRTIRGFIAYPLYVSIPSAHGDAAYVMADGYAYWERLHAASDLYHMNRVPRIIILDEQDSSGFNFVRQQSDKRVERAIAYLHLFGVPLDKITTVTVDDGAIFGSLSEAQSVARQEQSLSRIVVVTSAPHTRRSRLCFQRSLPREVHVDVYSASEPASSAEIDAPIWIEYCKLIVYYVFA